MLALQTMAGDAVKDDVNDALNIFCRVLLNQAIFMLI